MKKAGFTGWIQERITVLLRKVRLTKRMLISSVALPAITCLFIILLLSITAYSTITGSEREHVEMVERMIQYNLNVYLESIITPLNALSTKTSLVSAVNNYNKVIATNDWSHYSTEISGDIFSYFADNHDLYSIELTGTESSIISFPDNITSGKLESSQFMRRMQESGKRIVSFGNCVMENNTVLQKEEKRKIVIGVQIKSKLYSNVIGSLFVSIDPELFIEKIAMGLDESLYNIVVRTADDFLVSAKLCPEEQETLGTVLEELPDQEAGVLEIGGTNYLVSKSVTNPLEWNLMIFTNYDRMISKLTQKIYLCILIGIILVVILVLVTFFVSQSIIRPINQLVTAMQQDELPAENGEIQLTGSDELTYLAQNFNEMGIRIHTLFRENMEAQDQNRKIELDSLQAQINPHMLYNTLDSINWMAYLSGTSRICDIIHSLSAFYRLTLNQGKLFHSIQDELEQVEYYLMLEQFIYNDKISYEIQVNDAYSDGVIPRIILQPIVENAILHGFVSSELHLVIRVFAEKEFLMITVEDNGSGISSYGKEEVPVSGMNSSTNGYGLKNIDERLKLIYGEKYGITLQNQEEKGLLARVYLPQQILPDT